MQVLCQVRFDHRQVRHPGSFVAGQANSVVAVVGHKQAPALRARRCQGLLPGREIAVRVVGAAVKDPPFARAPVDQISAVLRACHPESLEPGLGVTAGGKVRAADELAEPADADQQRLTARRARPSQELRFRLNLGHLAPGGFDLLRKRNVEAAHYIHPAQLAVGDLVQLLFHAAP